MIGITKKNKAGYTGNIVITVTRAGLSKEVTSEQTLIEEEREFYRHMGKYKSCDGNVFEKHKGQWADKK